MSHNGGQHDGFSGGGGAFSVDQRPALQRPQPAAAAPAGLHDAAGGPLAAEAAPYWQRVKARAIERAAAMHEAQQAAVRSVADNVHQVQEAAKEVLEGRRTLQQRLRALWALWQVIDSGPLAKWVARAMVASYYVNQVVEEVEAYYQLKSMPPRRRWEDEPLVAPRFPYAMLWLVLPCALLVACGVVVPVAGGLLLAQTLYSDALMSWRQILAVVRHGSQPTELLAKRLAMIGAAMLVVAHSIKDMPKVRNYAGMLLAGEGEGARPGRRKSAALLAGRLLLACLFAFAGYTQVRRIQARGGSLWQASAVTPAEVAAGAATGAQSTTRHHFGVPDSHDNNWLLLELALGLPFVQGWQTAVVCRVLTGVLLAEAVTAWPFWAWYWPSWFYRAHVRLHFFVNVAVAGGLVLLQCLGAGDFTVDRLLGRKQD